jgi:hypothetical protein
MLAEKRLDRYSITGEPATALLGCQIVDDIGLRMFGGHESSPPGRQMKSLLST